MKNTHWVMLVLSQNFSYVILGWILLYEILECKNKKNKKTILVTLLSYGYD